MESGNVPPPSASGRRRESSPSAAATTVSSDGASGARRECGGGTLRELAGGSIASTTAVTGSWKLDDDDDDEDDHIALATLRSSFDRHSWRSSASSAPPSSSCSSPPASLETRRDSFSFSSSYSSVNNEPLQLLTPPHTHHAQSSSHLARLERRNSPDATCMQARPASSQQRSCVEAPPLPPPLRCAEQHHHSSSNAEGIARTSVAEPSAAALTPVAGEWSAPPALSLIFQQQQQLMLLQQQVQLLQQSYQMPQHQPAVLPPPPKPQMISVGVNTSFPWPATVPVASEYAQNTCLSTSTTNAACITSKSFVDSSSQTSNDVEAHCPNTRFQQPSMHAAKTTHAERSASVASGSPRSMISSGRFSSSSSSSSGGGSVLQEATYKQLHLRSWHDTLADYQLQRLSLEPALKPAAATLPPMQESHHLLQKAPADVPRIVYVPLSDSSSDSDDEDMRLRDKYLRGMGWLTDKVTDTDNGSQIVKRLPNPKHRQHKQRGSRHHKG